VKVGEVIEARTEEFLAESDSLHQPPPLGSLVWVRDGPSTSSPSAESAGRTGHDGNRIYAVVGSAATGSREPGRPAVALGQSEEDLPKTYPHLSKLLRTTFAGLVVGHETVESTIRPTTEAEGTFTPHLSVGYRGTNGVPGSTDETSASACGLVRHYLPPRPAQLHSFVYLAQPEEVRRFTASLDFLPILASGEHDEALCACLRLAAQAYPDPSAFLMAAAKELVPLLASDAGRLQAVLLRLRPSHAGLRP